MDDEASFREFVAARLGRLSRIAYLLTGDHHAAEDLVQLLVEAAEGAREYDVTDRAVRVVKRRRLMVRLVPVAAAVLVAAGLTAIAVPFGGGGNPAPLPVAAAGLPGRLVPQASPPMLPEGYPLPAQIPAAQRSANGGVEYGQPDTRYLLGIHADGPLLLHLTPSRSDPFTAGSVSIELIARDTGTLSTVTVVSRPITLICYPG